MYEQGEKSTKYFLNLEKKKATTGTIRTLIDENGNEQTESKNIMGIIKNFYENLFANAGTENVESCRNFLNKIITPVLDENDRNLCDAEIKLDDLHVSLCDMENNKSPGNDGLTKEFYMEFWGKIGHFVFESLVQGKITGKLSTSQRQAVIKLLEKKGRDKRLIKNWRPISLLNVDVKLLTKALASKIKNVLPILIKSDQTAYVANRFIGESARLISDILEMTQQFNINGFLVTVDIEKAFDSMDHNFLFAVLEKFGFGESFIQWIKVILKNQESSVINGGITTWYFSLQRGARQGDPISAYLFILVLEILFISIRSNENIEGIKIFDKSYKLTAYADDTTFFLQNKKSIEFLMESFKIFSKFSGLKPNTSKCEISGIGAKRGEYVALCGMRSVNLSTEAVKILGIYYSYNENVMKENNYLELIKNVESIVNIWKMRKLTLIGKITIFKTLVLSKVVFLSFLTNVPNVIIRQLENIQNMFLWDAKRAKIKHKTLIGSYENGGLKSVDIECRINALQLSWIKRLFDNNDHDWKCIPKYFIKKYFGNQEIFYPNFETKIPDEMPCFYKNIIAKWSTLSLSNPVTVDCIYTQKIWYNHFIKINNSTFLFTKFAKKGVNFIKDFYNENGMVKSWLQFKNEFNCIENMFFSWRQIIGAIPVLWKRMIHEDQGNAINKGIYVQNLLRVTRQLTLDKMTSKEFYSVMVAKLYVSPTSEKTIQNILNTEHINWPQVYNLSGKITIDTYSRMFNFKLNHNILYLNKSLTIMGILKDRLCSFCKTVDETPIHLFCECYKSVKIWREIQIHFINIINLPDLTPQSAFLSFYDIKKDNLIINNVLLIFKMTLYHYRAKGTCSFQHVMRNIKKIKNIENEITSLNKAQHNFHLQKWVNID